MDNAVLNGFEQALWFAYGFTSPDLNPEELFRECFRRARQPQYQKDPELLQDLEMLYWLRRQRQRGNLLSADSKYVSNSWQNTRPVDPDPRIIGKSQRTWALLIGNSDYSNLPLRGSRNDAQAMKNYLEDYLQVPKAQIQILLDANRAEMVNALYDLRDNSRIRSGDNILFYFSGHSAAYPAEEYITTWPEKLATIVGICPIDRGKSVPDISDIELNMILQQMRSTNITVILDCSYSGGAFMTPPSYEHLTSSRPHCPTSSGIRRMLEAAYSNPRRTPIFPPIVQSEDGDPSVPSFVLLAACQGYEHASEIGISEENPWRSARTSSLYGHFTCALLKVLQSELARGATFESITRGLPVLRTGRSMNL
ncbi:hypothetical protein CVT26_006784 [Gymnopilus dilepis]|uniref:Peptidase C14 caspase domain-containing protein n=1 Tax=Gymnopilus dilepis TaxID=231916 RepID=A0A409Y370_9AGAR|nr:hypothetical protein CVT26_006784 [Gymnopilus dilepis]